MATLEEKHSFLKNNFIKNTKKVLKENVSTNQDTLNRYKKEITESYNAYITFVASIYHNTTTNEKTFLSEQLRYVRTKLNQCYGKLNCNLPTPENLLQTINTQCDEFLNNSLGQESESNSESDTEDKNKDLIPETKNKAEANMAETNKEKLEFLKLSTTTLNSYEGDPLTLQSFLDGIELLETFATTNDLKILLQKSILTKLGGRAREAVPKEPTNIQEIIDGLKAKIRPESSKVIEGKFKALKTDHNSLQNFTDKTNELAEGFRRTLILEGIPSNKADEMTIVKTIEVCRANARTDLVKSVLAATQFQDHKEVVAKFVVEINNERQEKQVLSFKSGSHNNFKNNFNRNNKKNYNNKGKNQNNKNNNYRGKKFHNNRYNNREGNFKQVNSNNRYENSRSNQNVRYSENSDAPQWHLGDPESDQQDQQSRITQHR